MNIAIKILTVAVMVSFFSCSGQAQQGEGSTKNLGAKDFSEQINQMPEAQILDVRTPEEWQAGTLPGASRINWFDKDFAEKVARLDTTKPVMVYCASGRRSAQAMEKLNKMGFLQVYNLTGGIGAWRNAGYNVVQ